MSDPRSPYLFPVDLDRFWADDRASHGHPMSTAKPQVPLGISMPATCVWDELGLPQPADVPAETHNPYDVARELRRRYNDRAEELVGRRFLPEDDPPPADSHFPGLGGLTDIFEAPTKWAGGTGWVMPACDTPADLEALLDRVERRDLREVVVPANWEAEAQRIFEQYGRRPALGGGIRGPVTAAMSIYGCENLIYLILDAPELAARFRDLLAAKIIELNRLCYTLSGTPDRHGFGFADDNCALLNYDLYAFFGQPILRAVFEEFCPGPHDARFQHSDSAMAHLMPLLNDVGLNGTNFGPEIPVQAIRAALPNAVIHGQLRPWTFARGTDEEVAAEVRRDIQGVGADGGLLIATAGSINAGSRLSGLRAILSVIQHEGRYQPL